MNKYFSVAFIALASFMEIAAGQGNLDACDESNCVEDIRISCDTLVTEYDLQGSCCSLEVITEYDGCRVSIGSGNCYWFPKCGDCPSRNTAEWQNVKCGVEYRDLTNRNCPASEYPTNWKTAPPTSAPASSNSPTWADYSCAPSMNPAMEADPTPSAAPAPASVQVMGALGMVMAIAQM